MMGVRITLATLLVGACTLVSGPDFERYVVHVDRIEAPASVGSQEMLTLRLIGTIGPDGCHALDRVDVLRSGDRIDITVRGRVRVGEGFGCTQAVVPLDHELVADPPFSDPVEVVAHNPDGSRTRVEIPVS